MSELINDDMNEWSAKLIDISSSADTPGMVPPGIDSLRKVSVPEWENLRSYIRLGGLRNVVLHARNQPAPAKRPRTQGPARAPLPKGQCFGSATPQGYRYGQGCIFTHGPVKKGGGGKGSGRSQRRKHEDKAKGGKR